MKVNEIISFFYSKLETANDQILINNEIKIFFGEDIKRVNIHVLWGMSSACKRVLEHFPSGRIGPTTEYKIGLIRRVLSRFGHESS